MKIGPTVGNQWSKSQTSAAAQCTGGGCGVCVAPREADVLTKSDYL